MTTGSLLLGFALFIVVLLVLSRPLMMARRERPSLINQREALLFQKEALLEEIRQLDFDHETGKVPDDVYDAQRAYLMAKAAEVLEKLDALPAGAAPVPQTPAVTADAPDEIVAQIEAAILRLRQPAPVPTATNGRAGFCTQCGTPLDAGDKFCAACGHPVPAPAPANS